MPTRRQAIAAAACALIGPRLPAHAQATVEAGRRAACASSRRPGAVDQARTSGSMPITSRIRSARASSWRTCQAARSARQHGGGALGAGRAYAAARLQQSRRAGAAGACQLPGQRQEGLRPGRVGLHLPVLAAGQFLAAGAHAGRARGLCQGAPRPAQLWLARRRHRRASRHRVAGQAHRHRGRTRALPGDHAADDGRRCGHAAVHFRHGRQFARHGRCRQGDPARRHRRAPRHRST